MKLKQMLFFGTALLALIFAGCNAMLNDPGDTLLDSPSQTADQYIRILNSDKSEDSNAPQWKVDKERITLGKPYSSESEEDITITMEVLSKVDKIQVIGVGTDYIALYHVTTSDAVTTLAIPPVLGRQYQISLLEEVSSGGTSELYRLVKKYELVVSSEPEVITKPPVSSEKDPYLSELHWTNMEGEQLQKLSLVKKGSHIYVRNTGYEGDGYLELVIKEETQVILEEDSALELNEPSTLKVPLTGNLEETFRISGTEDSSDGKKYTLSVVSSSLLPSLPPVQLTLLKGWEWINTQTQGLQVVKEGRDIWILSEKTEDYTGHLALQLEEGTEAAVSNNHFAEGAPSSPGSRYQLTENVLSLNLNPISRGDLSLTHTSGMSEVYGVYVIPPDNTIPGPGSETDPPVDVAPGSGTEPVLPVDVTPGSGTDPDHGIEPVPPVSVTPDPETDPDHGIEPVPPETITPDPGSDPEPEPGNVFPDRKDMVFEIDRIGAQHVDAVPIAVYAPNPGEYTWTVYDRDLNSVTGVVEIVEHPQIIHVDVQSLNDGYVYASVLIEGETFENYLLKEQYLIRNVYDLQSVSKDVEGEYTLMNDIDASLIENFVPITRFTGIFNGDHHKITSLTINLPETFYVGLFSRLYHGRVENLILDDVDITGNGEVGALTGLARGAYISDVSVLSGKVSGMSNIGGLIGRSDKGNAGASTEVFSSSAHVDVKGMSQIGGFAGYIKHMHINDTHATGDIEAYIYLGGVGGDRLGGFAGVISHAFISKSSASGNIIIEGAVSSVPMTMSVRSLNGGFAGIIASAVTINESFALGNVKGRLRIGGFAGYVHDSQPTLPVSINNSYARGQVAYSHPVQGTANRGVSTFIGSLGNGTLKLSNNYSTSEIIFPNGDSAPATGGLIGENRGTLTIEGSYFLQTNDINAGYPLVALPAANGETAITTTSFGMSSSAFSGDTHTAEEAKLVRPFYNWDSTLWAFGGEVPVLRNNNPSDN